jgi:uncharacterized membrane protein YhaH (DUF805 family)
MSTLMSKSAGHPTRSNYWLAISIWIAVLAASLAAVTASIANVPEASAWHAQGARLGGVMQGVRG